MGATLEYGSNGMWVCNIMPCGRCEWCRPSAQSNGDIYYGCIGHSLTHIG